MGAARWSAAAVFRVLVLILLCHVPLSAQQEGDKYRQTREWLELSAVPRLLVASNQLQCVLYNDGNICTYTEDFGGGGGWFPTGSANSYIFNSGFQIAGITADGAGPWARDTAGAYFFNGYGNFQGTHLTQIYSSLDPDDLASWPQEAYVNDPDVFAPVLLGRKAASPHDTWVQYWDGDPARTRERSHPMGIRVTQRSMAWSYPSGNESVIYFVLEFENVTADAEFQRLNELAYFGGENALPDEGWSYHDVYVAFAADHDVGNAFENMATPILPFDMTIAYHGGFDPPPYFELTPSISIPPFFAAAPGMAGVKYLKSPADPLTGEEIGLSMVSVYTIGPNSPFPDPIGIPQLWRYLAGKLDLSLGDRPCNVTAEIASLNPADAERSVCYVPISAWDIRFYQASGPFSLAPGEKSTVVAAHLVAPTVETMPDGSPSGVVESSNPDTNPPGVPSFHPGFASSRGCDAEGLNCTDVLSASENPVKPIERAAGWVSYSGSSPSGERYPPEVEHPTNRIDQFGVTVVPGSLLGRALVAQTVFENDFLLGFAPERPEFYLVPGNNNVTVLWDPSTTETEGDPFFEIAGDPESALYNPNYRRFDVEGYRIWRSTDRGDLRLIAQFDFDDTRYTDYTCETVHPEEDVGVLSVIPETGDTIPVIGFGAGEICPATEENPLVRAIDGNLVFNNGGPGGGPGAGVTRNPAAVSIDTAIVADRDIGEVQPLTDTGVPYVYVDSEVYNNFTYFYSVTAFDVNSMASGPHTLRSAKVDQAVTPRQDAQNLSIATIDVFLSGDDGQRLDPDAGLPSLDAEDGTFDGPMPATDGMDLTLAPLVDRLTGQFNVAARVDSFKPDTPAREACIGGVFAFQSVCARAYLTVDGAPVEVPINVSNWAAFGRDPFTVTTVAQLSVPFDSVALEQFGIPEAASTATASVTQDESINFINWEGQQNRRGVRANTLHGGARWFSGTEETTPDPTKYIRVGHLIEVDSVWVPVHHTATGPGEDALPNSGSVQYFGYYLAHLGRAADFRVTWQADGSIAVRDVTHNVDVPFSAEYGSSWGFLNDDGDGDGVISWWDFFCVGPMLAEFEAVFGTICPDPLALQPTPSTNTIALNTEGDPTTGSTETGFTLFLNGMRHFFVGSLPPAETVWTLRAYTGTVTASTGVDTDDPGGYQYYTIYDAGRGASGLRPALIPGLTFNWVSESSSAVVATFDLEDVHTVPDPYLATSRYDYSPTTKQLMFVNLPPRATIRIYTLTGVLVDQIEHDDPTGGGRAVWDMRNRNNQFVASGVYFFHVVTPEGDERVGKFTILIAT